MMNQSGGGPVTNTDETDFQKRSFADVQNGNVSTDVVASKIGSVKQHPLDNSALHTTGTTLTTGV